MTKTRTKKFGRGANMCKRCGRKRALVRKYGIFLCRQCFNLDLRSIGDQYECRHPLWCHDCNKKC